MFKTKNGLKADDTCSHLFEFNLVKLLNYKITLNAFYLETVFEKFYRKLTIRMST